MQRSYRNNKRLLHDNTRNSKLLECATCPDYRLCGGLAVKEHICNCIELCKCTNEDERMLCTHVCPNSPLNFARRAREVGGYELKVPPTQQTELPVLPRMIPIFKDTARRHQIISLPAIAVRLDTLFKSRTGNLKLASEAELKAKFLVTGDTKIVINGIGFDGPLESYWYRGRSQKLFEQLRELKADLITTPNFSLVTDLPRQSDFHSMKRIAICWHELASAGNLVALHVNARTEKDYQRWLQFLNEHTEIAIIAFEFTSGGRGKRGLWHKTNLLALADKCKRPLSLVYRGHIGFAKEFANSFKQVSVLYAKPYTATQRRQLLEFQPGKPLAWSKFETPAWTPLDDLFARNLDTATRYVNSAFEGSTISGDGQLN